MRCTTASFDRGQKGAIHTPPSLTENKAVRCTTANLDGEQSGAIRNRYIAMLESQLKWARNNAQLRSGGYTEPRKSILESHHLQRILDVSINLLNN